MILVVDDEPLVLEVASKLFNFLGYDCLKAKNFDEGLNLFKNNYKKIKLVVVDIILDERLSIETFFSEIRSIDENVKIVISSGNLNHSFMKDYKKHGFIGIIKKPYGLKELKVLIDELLK